MNKLKFFTMTTILSTIISTAAKAGDVTIPNIFASDTPAVAAEVNSNFTAVETEVDDNNGRITSNRSDIDTNITDIVDVQTQTQNLSTGCPDGQSIKSVAANGSVTCEVDDNTNTTYSAGTGLNLNGTQFNITDGGVGVDQLRAGSVTGSKLADDDFTIPGNSFLFSGQALQNAATVVYRTPSYVFPGSGQSPVSAYAAVNLPRGVILRGLECGVYDNAPSGYIIARLYAYHPDTRFEYELFRTDISVDTGTSFITVQNLSDTSINESPIGATYRSNYQYSVRVYWSSTPGETLRLYSCNVLYN